MRAGSGRGEPTVRGPASATLFSARPLLASLDLSDSDIAGAFGKDWREVERDDGGVLSFFAGANRHVVLKAKELQVLRPHGHLIRSGDHLVPDEASLTSTTWMAGVFHSLVTQGHVSINRVLSTARSYLGLLRSGGQRIFVELEDGYHLLDVPSAYEMAPNGCRWLYKHRGGMIQVCSWAPLDHHALHLSIEVLAGAPCRFLIAHHVAINGDDGADAIPVHFTQGGRRPQPIAECGSRNAESEIRIPHSEILDIHPPADSDVGRRFPQGFYRIDVGEGATVGGDELLFVDGRSRRQPFRHRADGKNRVGTIADHGPPDPGCGSPCRRSHITVCCGTGRRRAVLERIPGSAGAPSRQ